VVGGLATALIVVSLVLALWAAGCAALDRLPPKAHLQALFGLQALVLVQAVVALVRLGGGYRPEETATFLGYLAGVLLVPVAGVLWSRNEPSRWAGTVVGIAALVAAVMLVRLQHLWDVPGA